MTPFQMEALVDALGLADVDLMALRETVSELITKRGLVVAHEPGEHLCPASERVDDLEGALHDALDILREVERPIVIKAVK